MKIRKPHFFKKISAVKPVWMKDDPFMSHLFNALSLTFPGGEDFFRRSVKDAVNANSNYSLASMANDLKVFYGQEALHSKVHIEFNQMLGTKISAICQWIEKLVHNALYYASPRLSPELNLSITCALEHATALLAETLLSHPDLLAAMDTTMKELWSWHAVEELEHKGVAYDVYNYCGYSYEVRAIGLLFVTAVFGIVVSGLQLMFMLLDGSARPSIILNGLKRLWIHPGYLRKAIPAWFNYLKKDFHPNHNYTGHYVSAYDGKIV